MSGPDPADIWQEVLGWLRVAENDRRAAKVCIDVEPPLHDVAAFHCQQAGGNLLKGFLVHASIDFGKTHDLEKLGQIVVARFPPVEPLAGVMRDWTNWNIAYRYPDIGEPAPLPTADELSHALDLIANLAEMLRTLEPPSDKAPSTMETNP